MGKTVGIVGTLDTKGMEFQFIKEQIEGKRHCDMRCEHRYFGRSTLCP